MLYIYIIYIFCIAYYMLLYLYIILSILNIILYIYTPTQVIMIDFQKIQRKE